MTDIPLVPVLDCDHVVARLAAQVPDLRHIDTVADLATVQDEMSIVTPSAWVLPTEDEAERSGFDAMYVGQEVTTQFVIVLALANHPTEWGEGGSKELNRLRQYILHAMLGWQPPDCNQPTWYVRGALVSYSQQVVWWEQTFATQLEVRQANQ